MNDDPLERIEIKPSIEIEKIIFEHGLQLYNGLIEASRPDEISLLKEFIGTYTCIVSNYGEKSGCLPESLAVDLNEAVLLKFDGNDQWRVFADNFRDSLEELSAGS